VKNGRAGTVKNLLEEAGGENRAPLTAAGACLQLQIQSVATFGDPCACVNNAHFKNKQNKSKQMVP
jgi:hypothetical protein